MLNVCGVKGLKILILIFLNETIPTKIFTSMSGRKIELCFSCYEYEKNKSNLSDIDFKKNLDLRWEVMKMLKF